MRSGTTRPVPRFYGMRPQYHAGKGGFPLRLTAAAILTAWRMDVCVLVLCEHCLPSNHDAENGRHGCRNKAPF